MAERLVRKERQCGICGERAVLTAAELKEHRCGTVNPPTPDEQVAFIGNAPSRADALSLLAAATMMSMRR